MTARTARAMATLGLLVAAGCCFPVGAKVDRVVCDLAALPRDLEPLHAADQASPPPDSDAGVQAASFEEQGGAPLGPKSVAKPGGRLTIPAELQPGRRVSPIKLPPLTPETKAAREKALDQLFPPLPPLGEDVDPPPGPEGRPLTLADLQRLALSNSPLIKQAVANVEAARGAAIQAGLPPNPIVGYQGDTAGTGGGPGYQGGFIQQTIKTGNKLQLARAVAAMDLRNAELALRRAQTDLATRVRAGYFGVLVAQEGVRINRALVRFSAEVYSLQLDLLRRGGFAAPYEPMYLRALATQARGALVQARNRRTAAWKRLAADLGLPGLPPVQLAGRIDVPIPVFDHKDVLARALADHTDVRTAEATYHQAQLSVKLAQVTPVPDVDVKVLVQKDRTTPPFLVAHSVAVQLPLPVWDRNQGGILQAQGQLIGAAEGPHRVRAELTSRLAEAFKGYEDARILLSYYRDGILPDLVRVYQGVYERYQREPAVPGANPPTFGDVVVAQQNLANGVTAYVTALGDAWRGVVDVADLLQTDDLFRVAGHAQPTEGVPAIPELGLLPKLPCCHPCSPLPGLHQQVLDGDWQPAVPDAGGGKLAPFGMELPPPTPVHEMSKLIP